MNKDIFNNHNSVPIVKNFSKPESRRLRDRSGFSVIEIVLVVVIIGLLAALAIPSFQKIRHQANVNKFLNDLRVLSGQFESYHFANGTWPSDTVVGELPPEMDGYIGSGSFAQTNAVGGQWKWHNNNDDAGVGIRYAGTDREHILYQSISERIDNGDIMTGRFYLVDSTTIVWVLSE